MIELLVDRLRWPDALVRERAASQLGDLIAEGNRDARDELIAWISRQELESLSAIGLLPFLYAASRSCSTLPSTEDLRSACKANSILYEMFLGHLDPSYSVRPEGGDHSGTPAGRWQEPNAASSAPASMVSKNLLPRLARLESTCLRPVTTQFDYEVAILTERHGESPMQAFWAQGDVDRVYHPVWYPRSTEIRLSAYLRTLAWLASNNFPCHELLLEEATYISPIDLGLWGVKPVAQPEWWPSLQTSGTPDEVNEETVTVLRDVERAVESLGTGPRVVLAASGCLSQTEVRQYDLEIRSFFQKPDGPERPESQTLSEYLRTAHVSVNQEPSLLRFEGKIADSTARKRLSDWFILPCSGWTLPEAAIVWQTWRGMRGIQCPSGDLADGDIHVVCREHSIDYESDEGLIAQWHDWSQGLSAVAIKDLKPSSGWALVAPRHIVDEFSERTGMKLAWSWELISHFRDHSFGDFIEHRMYGDHGTTRIIRP